MPINCPELVALPEDGLSKITSRQRIQIKGTDSREQITNVHVVVWLKARTQEQQEFEKGLQFEKFEMTDCSRLPYARTCGACQFTTAFWDAATTGGDDRDIFPDGSMCNRRGGQSVSRPCCRNTNARLRAWKAHCNLLD